MNRLNLDGGVDYLVDRIKGALVELIHSLRLFGEREEVVLRPIET
jgi:hypothetical protein